MLVLDEAHLVPPFEALLQSVRDMTAGFQRRAALPVRPMQLMSLSATGRSASGRRFGLDDADGADASVAARLGADKRLLLQTRVAEAGLADALAACALQRGTDGSAVMVFCDKRKTAHDVGKALALALAKRHGKTRRVELLGWRTPGPRAFGAGE